MRRGKRGNYLLNAVKQLNGTRQHLPGRVDEDLDVSGRYLASGQLDGRFDQREGETFDAVTKVGQVALLGGVEFRRIERTLAVTGQQVAQDALGPLVEQLVLPEGIVGIECNYVKHKLTRSSGSQVDW